jgi:colanic acid/amylovoran biosynthesis glycosyltransferase
LVHEKGLPQGIRAVRKLLDSKPDLHLRYHIVGEGLMEIELRKLVDELGLNGTVRFLGGMVQSDVIREFQKADIFLLPSVEEALGVVLLEAQAIGLPVLATDVGSVHQALRDGESGYLVPPENPDLLAQRLIGLLEHRDRWPEMGRAGRMFVEKYYDIRNLNRRLEEIFENLSSS